MQVEFDWTINVGTMAMILVYLVTFFGWGGKFYLMVRDSLKELKTLLREFPPHRHTDSGDIMYPKGMGPGNRD